MKYNKERKRNLKKKNLTTLSHTLAHTFFSRKKKLKKKLHSH
ncbi:unnamed protein product [Arabidopsis halleri]